MTSLKPSKVENIAAKDSQKQAIIKLNYIQNRLKTRKRTGDIQAAIATLTFLVKSLGSTTGYRVAWPAVETIAKDKGKSPRTIKRHLRAIKTTNIFTHRQLLPTAAEIALKYEYGHQHANFDKCKGNAPTLYIANPSHWLWKKAKVTPEQADNLIETIKQQLSEQYPQHRSLNDQGCHGDMPKGCHGDTQFLKKKETEAAPSSVSSSFKQNDPSTRPMSPVTVETDTSTDHDCDVEATSHSQGDTSGDILAEPRMSPPVSPPLTVPALKNVQGRGDTVIPPKPETIEQFRDRIRESIKATKPTPPPETETEETETITETTKHFSGFVQF